MTQDTPVDSDLYVVVTHNPFAFIYEGFTPTITINGASHRRRWGAHQFKVPPGTYEVSVSYPWLFSPECGKNTVHFEVQAGKRKTITYRAGFIRFLPGKMAVK